MRIGILQCDTTNKEFRQEHGDYPDMFISMFKSIEKSLEIRNYNVVLSQYPKYYEECDAYLITGSRYSVYEEKDWIKKLEKYVVELNKIKLPLIGVCFGHQMVARALGGKTERAKQGWGVGVHEYKKVSSSSWFEPNINDFSIIAVHQDQVTELPEGAVSIAESDFCHYAAFQVDQHILTFQGHPEFTKSYSKALMFLRKKILGEEVFRRGLKSLENPIQPIVVSQCIKNFLSNTDSR